MADIKEILEIVRDKRTLLSWPVISMCVIAVLGVGIWADSTLKELIPDVKYRFGGYAIIACVVFLFLRKLRMKLPKRISAKETSLAIAFAIEPANKEAEQILENEFAAETKAQIEASSLQDIIEIIPCDNHQAKRIGEAIEAIEAGRRLALRPSIAKVSKANWATIHQTVQADYYLWGKLYKQGTKFVLDFKGFIDDSIGPGPLDSLLKEYKVLEVKKRIVDESEAITGLAIEAKYFYIISRYIVSLVALYTGRFQESFRVHKTLETDLKESDDFAAKDELRIAFNKRLSTMYLLNSQILMSEGKIPEAEAELEIAKNYDPTNGSVYMFSGANDFILRRNWQRAWDNIQLAKQFAPEGNRAWEYSVAFLLMHKGDYRAALLLYDKILNNSFDGEEGIVYQVIGFNHAVLNQDKNYIPSQFIIPLMVGKKLGKLEEGILGFQLFLNEIGKSGKYQLLRTAAKKYQSELKVQREIATKVDELLDLAPAEP